MALDFPTNPTTGQQYGGYVFDGTKWKVTSTSTAPASIGTTAPVSASIGDMWWNSNDGTQYLYYNDGNTSQWVESRSAIISDGYYSPNYIINGGFDIWQRGTSFANNQTSTYSADRWVNNAGNTGLNVTVSRQSFSPGELNAAGGDALYFARINRTSAGTGVNSYFEHRVEDVRTLAGRTVTLSFYAKASAAYTFDVGNLYFYQVFGSGGSAGVPTQLSQVTLSTVWSRYSFTVTLPSITGKTVNNNDSYLDVVFNFPSAKGTFTIDMWGVQLEEGSVATPFRRSMPTLAGELAACQRYYYRNTALEFAPIASSCFGNNAANGVNSVVLFPVRMRAVPSSVESNNTCVLIPGVNYFNVTGVAIDRASFDGCVVNGTCSSVTTGRGYVYASGVGGGGYLGFSAEL